MKRIMYFGLLIVLVSVLLSGCGPSSYNISLNNDSEESKIESTINEVLKDSNLTTGQKNALRSAENYFSHSAFSHSGLIRQLEFEGYTNEDATYAADHCGADWNEQAVKSAKSYLKFSAFSYSGMIKQLEFEGFTTQQATYGADKCGANWNEQAAKCAKNYLDISSFSKDALFKQLEFEGFTAEQAEYGLHAVGY